MNDIAALILALPPTTLVVVLVVWGIGPGVVTRIASVCYRRNDPRRKAIVRGVYRRSWWVQPLWAVQQLERGVIDGLWPRLVEWRRARR